MSTGGKSPRKQVVTCGRPKVHQQKVRLPVASECVQEPATKDAKDVVRNLRLDVHIKGVRSFMRKTGNTQTSASVTAGGVQWQLRVTAAVDDGGVAQLGCSLEGVHENGAWSRWLAADFFVFDQKQWRKLGGVREKLVGSAPLPFSAGEPRLVSAQTMFDGRYSYVDKHNDCVKFRVDFTCWKDSFQEKGPLDDVTFVVEGRPVYANKGYITYISPVLSVMLANNVLHMILAGNFKEDNPVVVPITQTSAEGFVMFMRAVAPFRDPVSDGSVQVLYGMANLYEVEFLRADCEKHLLATKGIAAIEKLLLAQWLNQSDFITRLMNSLSLDDLKEIESDKRKDELSVEVKYHNALLLRLLDIYP